MKRRDFLKSIFYTTSAAGLPLQSALAGRYGFPELDRTLVNVMLLGGADLRFLFVPHPDEPATADYLAPFWNARQAIYQYYSAGQLSGYLDYRELWEGAPARDLPPLYEAVEFDGFRFGIHRNAGWLIRQFRAGNVAIVCNVFASENRRHDHSQLIVHTGNVDTPQFNYDVSGWGGRLAEAIGATANVVPVSDGVPPFAHASDPGNRLARSVHIRNSRDFALPNETNDITDDSSVLGRALKAYYTEHRNDVDARIDAGKLPPDWPFRKFLQHEAMLRQFGDAVDARIRQVNPQNPLKYLHDHRHRRRLNNTGFGLECANLYDALVAHDILQLRIAYLELSGWDTHHTEKARLEKNLADLFGERGGLAALERVAETPTRELVYVFTSDFGRQLAANGGRGTDHGVGSYTILIGEAVNGGIYGEMFPASESTPDADGRTRFDKQGADIQGRTALDRVLGEVADWIQPGAAPVVFPRLQITNPADPAYPPVEAGVDLSALLAKGNEIAGKAILNGTGLPLADVRVTATDASGFRRTGVSNNHGHYHLWGLPDGDFTLVPSKPYFRFEPASLDLAVSGGRMTAPAFTAIPLLQISYINVYAFDRNNNTHSVMALGHNFVPGQTTVTVGGTAVTIVYSTPTLMTLAVPAGATGSIVVTTPTERYTHPVPFDDLL